MATKQPTRFTDDRPVVGPSYYIDVQEHTEISSVHIYPNPASQVIRLEGQFENAQVAIHDLTGRKVIQTEYKSEIVVNQLLDGMYFLNITTADGQVITQKFIIRK